MSALNEPGDGFYYQGYLVYTKRGLNLSLESTSFSGGRFVASNSGFVPRYFVTDHLGSVRMVVNESGSVLELNDYYPYGGRWETGDITDNRYRYNGKETQEFVGFPYTDYGARMYNGISWFAPDPLAEKYYSISPYVFCSGNPVSNVDLNGMSFDNYNIATKYYSESGQLIADTRDSHPNRVVVVPNDRLSEFQEHLELTDENILNSDGWNDYWAGTFGEYNLSPTELMVLRWYHSEEARNRAIGYMINPSNSNFMGLMGAEMAAQWLTPELVINGVVIGVTALGGMNMPVKQGAPKPSAKFVTRRMLLRIRLLPRQQDVW